MTARSNRRIVAFSIFLLTLSSALNIQDNLAVRAQTMPARLEVWSPDVHSSNITDSALTPGSQFNVMVNITGAGPLLAFDVYLLYNITIGPNVLQLVDYPSVDPLSGGLIDPATTYPAGCAAVSIRENLDFPVGRIRMAASMTGGCAVPGTGTLFILTFRVVGTGATSIDIAQVTNQGRLATTIVEGVGTPILAASVPYQSFSAYFQNKVGIPPHPIFNFTPTYPQLGDSVQFNAAQSYDLDNPSAPNGGAQMEPVIYDTNNNQMYDSGEPVIVGAQPGLGTPLGAPPPNPECRSNCIFNSPDPHLVFSDTNGNGHWDPGETVVYDAITDLKFNTGDFVITGPPLAPGATLTSDPKLTYVDSHANNAWDNGYVWDWGDGSGFPPATGNMTSHVFQASPTVSAAGWFSVKLVVYDTDDGLPNRQIQMVKVGFKLVHDVEMVAVSLSNSEVFVGEPLGVAVLLQNRGPQLEIANLTITCSCPTNVTVVRDSRITLTNRNASIGLTGLNSFNYDIDTKNFALGTFNITAKIDILDPLTGGIIPDNISAHNHALASLTVLTNQPGAPVNFQLRATTGNATLTWSTPRYTGGSSIAGYKIYRSTSSSRPLTFVATVGNVTGYVDTTVVDGQTYYYKVTAVNAAGIESPIEKSVPKDVLVPSRVSNLPMTPPLWLAIAAAILVASLLGIIAMVRRRKGTHFFISITPEASSKPLTVSNLVVSKR